MKKMSRQAKNTLLSIHLAFMGIWLGTIACILIFLLSQQGELPMLKTIFFVLLIPSAVGTMKTGVLLALFSHWGLTKHYWIIAKIALSILLMIVQTVFMGSLIQGDQNGSMILAGIGLQILILLLIIVISVFKPWGKVSKEKHSERA